MHRAAHTYSHRGRRIHTERHRQIPQSETGINIPDQTDSDIHIQTITQTGTDKQRSKHRQTQTDREI